MKNVAMTENTDLILDDFESPRRFEPEYMGFWIRVAASLIDGAVLYFANILLTSLFMGSLFLNPDSISDNPDSLISRMLPMYSIMIAINWLYYALMESSANQGTLGKMAVGIKVCDMQGERISFGQATGRYFAKILSSLILLIGYIMVAFTEKKQGLHDMIAGTLVVRK